MTVDTDDDLAAISCEHRVERVGGAPGRALYSAHAWFTGGDRTAISSVRSRLGPSARMSSIAPR